MPDVLDAFHPLVAGWFRERFGAPTEPQLSGWPRIGAGDDVLIAAPTGSGKTLAAFLACMDELVRRGLEHGLDDRTQILYISPLKALSNDVHRNLEAPLAELAVYAAARGVKLPEIRVAVRTGDTPASERAKMAKRPPHILVTTPESLYILLTTERGRAALGELRTVIVDEIHAIAGDKRGAHLALSLERLERLVVQCTGKGPIRVGLSATQKPIERIARLLVGSRRPLPHICDAGHRREIDLGIEITDDELGAVASLEQFGRVYDRIAELVTQHRSTIVFCNTRRLVERAAAALEQRLGEEHVVAHHGSMSRALRLAAEQKLKHGHVKCAVATASLELGIDVGTVDLVVQIGSPRSIATLLQRVGRSGHNLGGTPKGRMFALTRDQLMECGSLVRGIRSGNLDEIQLRDAPLDILAQQIVAICAAEEVSETELIDLIRSAVPYQNVCETKLEQVLEMLSEGVSDRRGRTGAHVHRDRIAGTLKGRRGARLAAIMCGGAIPDNNNYDVVQWPEETKVGTVDEDFAIDSSAGDVFQLGNTAWKIRRIEMAKVYVEDAKGQPPTIPFWFGEAPARTRELSDEVSKLRGEIDARLATLGGGDELTIATWLADQTSMSVRAAQQLVAYLAAARSALGALPRKDLLIAERFFDEAGGMQLVIHAPLGGRINRAWGLALRKKFCVTFDFELQAIATDDGIVISLGQPHSFPLETVFGYVPSHQARDTLIQALLDRPMFEIRWRWNVTRSLTVLRRKNGKKVPPHLVKMRAADTLSVVFPQAVACGENIQGPREVPDHPLVFETVRDCLVEAMDLEGLRGMIEGLESGAIGILAKDTVEPSPLSHELLNANPYAFLDDAPLEERRTRAVQLRRGLPAQITSADEVGALDEAAIAAASEEVAPVVRDVDELHDALLALWLVPELQGKSLAAGADDWFEALTSSGRACRVRWEADGIEHAAWVATERLGIARSLLGPGVECTPMIATPSWSKVPPREEAVMKLVGAHLDHRGPVSARGLAAELGLPLPDLIGGLLALEGDGAILRGSFTPHAARIETAASLRLAVPAVSSCVLGAATAIAIANRPAGIPSAVPMRAVFAGADSATNGSATANDPKASTLRGAESGGSTLDSNANAASSANGVATVDAHENTTRAAESAGSALERSPTVSDGAAAGVPNATPMRGVFANADSVARDAATVDPRAGTLRGAESAGSAIVSIRTVGDGATADDTSTTPMRAVFAADDAAPVASMAPAIDPRATTMRAALLAANDASTSPDLEWCNRRVLARIHRLTLARLRKEIEPVGAAALMRFLLRWQRVAKHSQVIGSDGLARVVEQLQGFETAAGAWEREVLPARLHGYDQTLLDQLCLAGHVVWCRLSPRSAQSIAVEPDPELDAAPADQQRRYKRDPHDPMHPYNVAEAAAEEASRAGCTREEIAAAAAQALTGVRTPGYGEQMIVHLVTSSALMRRQDLAPVVPEAAPAPRSRTAPGRSAPLALMLRRDAHWLRAAAAVGQQPEAPILGSLATRVRDLLATQGASFLTDIVRALELPPGDVEEALWELVGAGLATADGFASLRVLVDRKRGEVKSLFDKALAANHNGQPPVRKWADAIKRARTRDTQRPGHALRALPTAAGRWSLLPACSSGSGTAIDAEASARQLLLRYGVVFRDLLSRESSLPPWRELLVALRRLEARGEIRGGRFVNGFVGEQFALPEALDELRAARSPSPGTEVCRVAATDPLNLVGILSPGPRVPAIVGNAVLFLDGQAVASVEAGQLVHRAPLPPGARVDQDLTYHPPPRPPQIASQAALPL